MGSRIWVPDGRFSERGSWGSSGGGVCYAPQDALASAKIGVSSAFPGGLVLTNTYNTRLQPLEFKASSTGGNAMDLTYNFSLAPETTATSWASPTTLTTSV